ncbi:similar to Saccharomyces cerevisiae YMR152W YIM1 Protein of unknown function [Maudiozyma saulgeensis]|uniref:Enoyl reductase (ER) domain-containing protein n=1 Tax=Maudiozyma saulgeensis TaxID=1789683 RepID=A0A1X7RBE6_9SACH|nr:similar to Saccharomyces cerevisiae YMR152W YIM1 Protein of unknown function [Kazachstania saulgeensis]
MTVVEWNTVSFVNRDTPPTITTEEIDLDTCFEDNQIVIEVYSAALNPVDFMLHKAAVPMLSSAKPKAYGRDFSGVIIRKGNKVSNEWMVGDKVNGMINFLYAPHGSLSNYLIINPERNPSMIHITPGTKELMTLEHNEFDISSSWPAVFGTAYAAIFYPGRDWSKINNVLVLGASTQVGNCFVQIVKNYLNVKNVVGVCNENSIEYNKEFGYDYLVSYNNGKTVENVKEIMETKLNGEKFDVIFDSCGSSDFLPVMNDFLKPKSTNSYYSTVVGDSVFDYKNIETLKTLKSRLLVEPYRRFKPWRSYNYYFVAYYPDHNIEVLGNEMIEKKQFNPQIDSSYKFQDFQKAIDRIMSGRCKGKVIVQIKKPDDI